MPPVLHPRSRTTLSLFTSTLVLSFAVVALPHVIPCPVPHRRRIYAEGETPGVEGGRKRRRKANACGTDGQLEVESGRECPIPKPSGLVGQILGFKAQEGESNGQTPTVKVEKYTSAIRRSSTQSKDS
jgi:cytochrome c oxidase assembly factor 2